MAMLSYRGRYCPCQLLILLLVAVVVCVEVLKLFSSSTTEQQQQHGLLKRIWGESRTWRTIETTLEEDSSEIVPPSGNHNGHPGKRKKTLVKGQLQKGLHQGVTPHYPNMLTPADYLMSVPTLPSARFQFVYSNLLKSPEDIFASSWLSSLQEIVRRNHPSKQVVLVFSDSGYMETLLNWLIASQVKVKSPLRNYVVICLDKNIFNILYRKDIPSVLIELDTVLRGELKPSSSIWVVRFLVWRLLIYFGYDVVSLDTDAVLTKDIQPMFDKYWDSDIIASVGTYPFSLGRLWGWTAGMGVVRFRSSPATDMLWKAMSQVNKDREDDQTKINFALKKCGIQWETSGPRTSRKSIVGRCSLPSYQRLKVTIVPEVDICRKCSKGEDHFAVHPMGARNGSVKANILRNKRLWFLRSDWKTIKSSVTGVGWLEVLAG